MTELSADSLSANQERAIVALLAAPSLETAAERCGLSVRTLWRYLQDSRFEEAYRKARRHQVSAATARLQCAAEKAVTALEEIAMDNGASASARVSACRVFLDMGYCLKRPRATGWRPSTCSP